MRNINRRTFLADTGMGFNGLALGAMMARGDRAKAPAAKAENVIWVLMIRGVRHLASIDPKPALNKSARKTIAEAGYKTTVLDSPYDRKIVRDFAGTPRAMMAKLYPPQIGFK